MIYICFPCPIAIMSVVCNDYISISRLSGHLQLNNRLNVKEMKELQN